MAGTERLRVGAFSDPHGLKDPIYPAAAESAMSSEHTPPLTCS